MSCTRACDRNMITLEGGETERLVLGRVALTTDPKESEIQHADRRREDSIAAESAGSDRSTNGAPEPGEFPTALARR